MVKTAKITFSKSKKAIIGSMFGRINNTLEFLKKESEDRTPEDTGILVSNYEIEPARKVGNIIKGKVVNDSPYAVFIEFGTRFAKIYHKPKGKEFFKSGNYRGLPGARMMTRAVDENRPEIKTLLSK